jgi:hypothetical protein
MLIISFLLAFEPDASDLVESWKGELFLDGLAIFHPWCAFKKAAEFLSTALEF